MKIIKYKRLTNGKYKVTLDTEEIIELYEDVILKYDLLITSNFDKKLLEEVKKDNLTWEVYYVALRSLKSRFKSREELKKLLLKKEYLKDDVLLVLDKLEEQGYIDDNSFCKSYINNQLITTNKGPKKIIRELEVKGIDRSIIVMEEIYTKDIQVSRIEKLIDKLIKANKNRGGVILKKKIVSNLLNLGYDIDIVNEVIGRYDFPISKDIYEKEYNKLYTKLSKKYSDKELEMKIKEKLYQKGLYYED